MPTRSSRALYILVAGLLGAAACGDNGHANSDGDDDVDSGQPDGGDPDGMQPDPDGGDPDGGDPDGPSPDGPMPDAPPTDGGMPDAPPTDGGIPDAPMPDAPMPDAPMPDAPPPDAPPPDAPPPDAPPPDAPPPDAPPPDAPPPAPEPETTITLQPPTLTNLAATRFEFISSIAGSTFTCRIDAGPLLPCASPYQLTFSDGTHDFSVHATSPQGVSDSSPAVRVWTIDTTAPLVTFDVAPPAFDNSQVARFQFSSEPLAAFACALDGAPFAPCSSPFQTTTLAEGAHAFEVRATDPAGNAGSPQRHEWTIDLGDPDTVIDSGPPALTAATTATFTFSSPDAGPGATFTCRHDSNPAAPCTSPWTVSGLGDAFHLFRVRVRDAAGNEDPTEASFLWHVDLTPPAVNIHATNPLIADPTPQFTFDVTGNDLTSTECRITGNGATAFAPCTSPYTAATIPDGDATFVVRVRDQVGHETIASRAFTIDATFPVITFTAAPPPVVNSTPVTVMFTVNEPTTNQCRHATLWTPCTDTYTTPMLADGNRVIVVSARDAAGNTTEKRVWFEVDTQTPVVSFTAGPTGVTAATTPTFEFQVSGGGTPSTFICRLDQLGPVPCVSPFTTPTLAAGAHLLTVTAIDGAGHTASATRAFTVDTTPLTVTITASPPSVVASSHPTVHYVATGVIAYTSCRYEGVLWTACENGQTSWAPTFVVPDGTHTYSIMVTDDTGASAVATSAPFTVDTTAPLVTFTSVPPQIDDATVVTFAFNVGADSVSTECRFYGQNNTSVPFTPCASPLTYTITSPNALQHVFQVRTRDAIGNQRTYERIYNYWP